LAARLRRKWDQQFFHPYKGGETMNRRIRDSILLVILVMSVTLALVDAVSAQEKAPEGKPGNKGWSALDKVEQLKDALGKATYASVSIYADKDRWFGVKDGTVLSPDFGDSASHFLPGDPDADKLYALKVARNCHGEDHCLQVNQPDFKDITDQTYTCELDDLDTPEDDPSQLDFNPVGLQ
jgi:hypothetical protein